MMAKKKVVKAAAAVAKTPAKPRKDPRIERIYEEEVTFTCPVRGKVTQKVKIKKFKPLGEQGGKHIVVSSDSIDELEKNDDGLSIYNDGELDLSKEPE